MGSPKKPRVTCCPECGQRRNRTSFVFPHPCEDCGQQLGLEIAVPVRIAFVVTLIPIVVGNHAFLPAVSSLFEIARCALLGGFAGLAFVLAFGKLVRFDGLRPKARRKHVR